MPPPFDPYYLWLGIPPGEHPPDHYRLLGTDRFEDNPEVISNTYEQRVRHVRTFELGERAAQSQQLLSELAAARSCLMDASRKAAYDEQLVAELEARNPPPAALPKSVSTLPKRRSRKSRSLNPRFKVAKIVIRGLAGLTIGMLLVWYALEMNTLGVTPSSNEGEAAPKTGISGRATPDSLALAKIRSRLVGTTWRHDAEHNKEYSFRFNADGTITASWHDLPSMWTVLPDGTVQMIFTKNRSINRIRVDASFNSARGMAANNWLYQRIEE